TRGTSTRRYRRPSSVLPRHSRRAAPRGGFGRARLALAGFDVHPEQDEGAHCEEGDDRKHRRAGGAGDRDGGREHRWPEDAGELLGDAEEGEELAGKVAWHERCEQRARK